ncbi:MAG: hypothetical protein V3V12_08870 [Gammaproteobacteria bacterium]
MKTRYSHKPCNGFATLSITLILITITTLLTLTVTHIQRLSLIESGNEQRYRKNYMETQSLLDGIAVYLESHYDELDWQGIDSNHQHSEISPDILDFISTTSTANIQLFRKAASSKVISLQLETKDTNDQTIKSSVAIRPHGILTDFGENTPPLVINGCLLSSLGDTQIYPDRTSDDPESILSTATTPCHATDSIDLHGGKISNIALQTTHLWDSLFTVSLDEFKTLAETEAAIIVDISQRQYLIATPEDLIAGTWQTSLGSLESPAILYIPAALNCPGVAGNVTIIGLVFYAGDCSINPLLIQGTVKGALILSSDTHLEGKTATLEHISHSGLENKLAFPITHAPQLPGTWIDY